MDPQLLTLDLQPTPKGRFQARVFRRMLGVVKPYRRSLVVGLLAVFVFAGLQTLGIGGVFPVLKILLEPEGLRGWVNRTAAGRRLGAEFASVSTVGQVKLRLTKVEPDSPFAKAGLARYDTVWALEGQPALEWLAAVTRAPSGTTIRCLAEAAAAPPDAPPQELAVSPADPDLLVRLLQRSAPLTFGDTPEAKLRALVSILAGLVGLMLLANVFRYFGRVLVASAVLRAMMDLRGRLYERTLHLPMAYFAGEPTADTVSRFVQDVQEVQRGLITLLGKFIREPLRAVLILGLAFTMDWRITLTMLIVVPLAVAVFWAVGRKVKRVNRRLLQTYGQMIGALTATLHNLRTVKVYTAEDCERSRLRQIDFTMFRRQLHLAKLEAFVSPMMETLALLAGSLVTVWLASRVLQQDLSLSKFVTLGFILSILFDPIRKVSDVYVRVQRATAGAERIFHLLDHPPESQDGSSRIELGPLERELAFEDVTFTYPGSEAPALRNVNLTIQRGEAVAIVGPNGSGKTTLVNMLPRLYNPDSGRILYDGVDLRDATIASIRRQIGLVSQEAVIFAGTPTENIAYGDPHPDPERVRAAARRALAAEFIENLPGQYEANLGERGTTLSAGQRQRLAIARAIYRDAPILIFDEATSNVDSDSERKIQAALQDLARERTLLIIAHRLSTMRLATRVVVMEAGRIVDVGTHEELLERCELYRVLFKERPSAAPTSG